MDIYKEIRLLVFALGSIGLVASGLGASAYAEGASDRVSLSGLLEIEVAIGAPSGGVTKTEFTFTPRLEFEVSSKTMITLIGRLSSDSTDDLEPGRPQEFNRSDISRRHFPDDTLTLELREAYLDTEVGDTFLRIGKQQIVWGQADGLKVLDVLNPQSFAEFILDDFEDSRIPLWSINAEVPIGEAFLQLIWIPDPTYDDLPSSGATFAFTSPRFVPTPPPGFNVTFAPVAKPDDAIEDSDFAAQLSALVSGWDVSLNYAWHIYDKPVVRRFISGTDILVTQSWERTHLIGGSVSNVFGDFTLRGEIGLLSDRYSLTGDPVDLDGVVNTPEISYVLGLDYMGWTDWFISGQLFQSHLVDAPGGLVRDDIDTSVTLLMRRNLMNEAMQVEAQFIHSVNDDDGVVQLDISYDYRDNLRLFVGADIFYGEPIGIFGQFDDQDRLTFGVEIGF